MQRDLGRALGNQLVVDDFGQRVPIRVDHVDGETTQCHEHGAARMLQQDLAPERAVVLGDVLAP